MAFWSRWFSETPKRPATFPVSVDRSESVAPDADAGLDVNALTELLDTGYRTTVDRIRSAGDASQRTFAERRLLPLANAVREVGLEKMLLTAQDGQEHSKAWQSDSLMIGVQTIPATREDAANWYTAQFNGYFGYVKTVITPIAQSIGCEVFVHVIFGQDRSPQGWLPWTSIAIFPSRLDLVSPLLPRTCCNAEERAQYRL